MHTLPKVETTRRRLIQLLMSHTPVAHAVNSEYSYHPFTHLHPPWLTLTIKEAVNQAGVQTRYVLHRLDIDGFTNQILKFQFGRPPTPGFQPQPGCKWIALDSLLVA